LPASTSRANPGYCLSFIRTLMLLPEEDRPYSLYHFTCRCHLHVDQWLKCCTFGFFKSGIENIRSFSAYSWLRGRHYFQLWFPLRLAPKMDQRKWDKFDLHLNYHNISLELMIRSVIITVLLLILNYVVLTLTPAGGEYGAGLNVIVVLVLEVSIGGLGTVPCCSEPCSEACSLQHNAFSYHSK
jgi:hypothetical protein